MPHPENKVLIYKDFIEVRLYHSKYDFSVRYVNISAGEAVPVLEKVKRDFNSSEIKIVYEADRFHRFDNITELITYYEMQYMKLSKRSM